MTGVEGSPIIIHGAAAIEITLAGEVLRADILVASGLSTQAILGLDFLQSAKCVINTEQRVLHIAGKAIPLQQGTDQHHALVSTVKVQETIKIPPFSELQLQVAITDPINNSGDWLLEALPLKDTVMVATTIVTPHNDGHNTTVPLQLANLSGEVVTIYKGSRIGQITQLDDSIKIASVSQNLTTSCLTSIPEASPQKQELLWKMVTDSGDKLTSAQQKTLYNTLLAFADVFTAGDDDLGHTDLLPHTIPTGIAQPIRQAPRRAPLCHRETVRKLLDDMLAKDVIISSKSPWASPVVLVQKKDGSVRFCIDYRKLNAVTQRDAYPLPRIDETLDTLSGSKWFSTLDLLSGYWQVGMDPRDREKTAFATHEGLFEFKVMPFGLCNAPATFQRLMNLVLAGIQWSKCLVYLDDIIVLGKSFEEHLQHLVLVLQRLREANLQLKPAKCVLFRDEVLYLGHVVSRQGIATDPAKTSKVSGWPTPTTVKEVQQFLGLASYYRRFVCNFATLAKPLYKLTERGRTFQWTKECAEAFAVLKNRLTTAPILCYPNYKEKFILDTDASQEGIGAVLSQRQGDKEVVIAYASRSLSKSERKYCVTRKELLSAVTFIHHFRPYLLGHQFLLRTDHGSLTWLQSFKEPEGQLARWVEQLQEYNFEIVHRPGRRHTNADAMSRHPCSQCQRPESECSTSEPEVQVAATTLAPQRERSTIDLEFRQSQIQDEIIGPVLTAKENGVKLSADELKRFPREVTMLAQQWEQLTIQHGVLYRKYENQQGSQLHLQLVVPTEQQSSTLHEIHGGRMAGHLGEDRTFKKLQERFYWPGYSQSVKEWCRNCPHCAVRKKPNQKQRAPLQKVERGYPLQMVAADIVGPLPKSSTGNKYILVVSDYFTKWAEAYGIPNQEAKTVANKLIDNMFCRFGVPEQLHTDMGTQFESTLVKEISKLLDIRKTHTTAYHPQGDGWWRGLTGP